MHLSISTSHFVRFRRSRWAGLSSATLLVLAIALLVGGCSSATPPSDGALDDAGVTLEEPADEAGDGSDADSSGASQGDSGAVQDAGPTMAPTMEPTATQGTTVVTLITGQVTDTEGEPITDASVAIVESTAPFPEMAIFTDASGTYTWYVEPGTYTIEVYRDGYVNNKGETEVAEGSSAQLDFVLESR